MELLLIRHAQTTSNVARALDTAHPGAALTALGEEQAQTLAAALRDTSIDRVYVSPRRRTRQTAAPLVAGRDLDVETRDGLVEVSAGDWEMATDPDRAAAYNATIDAWIRGEAEARVPGGEDREGVLARVDAVVEEALRRARDDGHDRVALVAHGAVLRCWVGVRAAGARHLALERPLGNTGLVRLARSGESWRVTFWDTEVVPGGSEDDGPVDTA